MSCASRGAIEGLEQRSLVEQGYASVRVRLEERAFFEELLALLNLQLQLLGSFVRAEEGKD